MDAIVPVDRISQQIRMIRGLKVMLDRDLAQLYNVETKRLKEQVRRNLDRFPSDFMFELTEDEFKSLRSQIATSNWGGTRYMPMAFTEQGVAMLSSVLRSKAAIQVNVQIMRAFVNIRHSIIDSAELKGALEELRNKTEERFEIVFSVLDRLISDESQDRRKIGFTEK